MKENTDNNTSFFLVGNKADLFEQEQVKEEEAKEYASSINAEFYLTSAKNNIRITELFVQCGKKFIDPDSKDTNNDENDEEGNKNFIINSGENKTKNACC